MGEFCLGQTTNAFALLFIALLGCGEPSEITHEETDQASSSLRSDEYWLPVQVRTGSTFSEALAPFSVSAERIRLAALPLHDLAHIRPDRNLQVQFVDGNPNIQALRYEKSTDETLIVALQEDGSFKAKMETLQYVTTQQSLSFTLDRSLWEDGLGAGLKPEDLARLSQIFEYQVDFNSELRSGASFSVVAQWLTAETMMGPREKLGDIYTARLVNAGESVTTVRFVLNEEDEEYFQLDGTSMKRQFLRSPIEFSRVTSGFNPRRFHPVLKRVRPHNGTDFGAPTGTPVRAVADGKVVFSGQNGGHGKHVKIDHQGSFSTSYSHLSRISVRNGSRVKQGQRIGSVGSTGLATGPHLHYQMWKNGRFVDPMRIKLPSGRVLPKSEKDAFEREKERWVSKLPS